ncbi:beta-xylosidase [Asticcacaulis biprosthecium C19]|uniref:Beta-xylosidase n=1 Tax=Asticcacaulis biprosthecium C19 TaxID=715226 RepID=F4QTH7_9CAUL|nr:glycoside hydrolase family 43 protein [Asticcacaulis biprosthecium]EGF90047.1 beta-xylosidase [Asticcacaulis biprosthecium C19]
MISNPVLPGFNPDPSIIRVGSDYYIATSTFEWFPGVQIHHSTDLVNWRLVSRPLRRPSQLDLRGVPDSCGIWAPCLSHAKGRFYLTYSLVRRYGRTTEYGAQGTSLRDFHNYVVTAEAIEGDWSDPVYLNSSGFDPSLFHDADGKSYLLNLLWDHRRGHNRFAGILMQPYDTEREILTGEPKLIFEGTELGYTEGPHLYRRDGWYYLVVAEGGTGWDHAVTLARSRALYGPYEVCPYGPILTSRGRPDLALQRAGHGDLVEAEDGTWLIAYLCARPVPGTQHCVLGRETALQPVRWTQDGWIEPSDPLPQLDQAADATAADAQVYMFDGALPSDFQWLRTPYPEALFSLSARPGHLTLFGCESIGSLFEQSLVGRRQTSFCYEATTVVDFEPESFQQSAGLVCYYNSTKFHYAYISLDEVAGRHLCVMSALPDPACPEALSRLYPLPDGPVELRVVSDGRQLRFSYRTGGAWQDLEEVFDATCLSDEATLPGHPSFTGTFVGMACQDTSGRACPAHFAGFAYTNRGRRRKRRACHDVAASRDGLLTILSARS